MVNKLIYISGCGRTASTMWSILFSEVFGLINLAQSRDLPKAIIKNEICSCGRKIRECVAVPDPSVKLAEELKMQNKFHRFIGKITGGYATKKECFYVHYIRDRFENSDCVIIDSSKSVRHLLLLRKVCNLRPFVVSFSRPQGDIARSWKKRNKSNLFIFKVLIRNLVRLSLLRVLSQLKVISYINFDFYFSINNPHFIINKFGEFIGVDVKIRDGQEKFNIDWSRQHIFPPADPEYIIKRTAIVVKTRK